jgi:Tfp pilus assembly protein PilF
LNRNTDAVNVLAKSQAEYPNSATLVSLTALLRQQGDVEKADSMLTDWIAEHPDDVAVRIAYAGSQLNANVLAAEAQYRAILKLQPYNADALNNFGWLLQQKNPKEALPYCERAAKIAPNSAAVLDTLAWTKWLLNDKSEALSLLERAHAGDSKNGEITYHLVLALDGNGRHEDARKLLVDLLGSKIDFLDKSAAQTLQAQWR